MTLEEMKKHEWVVSWSGGKDSTATIILMHENNIPIKEIVYVRMMYDNELPATLPVMTKFVDKTMDIFEEWGYKVTVIKPNKTAKDIFTNLYKRSKKKNRNGNPYGIMSFMRDFCGFNGVKADTIKQSINMDDYQMLGIAHDELTRLARLEERHASILDVLEVNEYEAKQICIRYGLLSPLYDLGLERAGCWFCPNACERDLIKHYYPDLYIEIKKNNWVKDYYEED